MIVPPDASASSSASADLPLAVGPAMTRTGGTRTEGCAGASPLVTGPSGEVGGRAMTMVLTLIAGIRARQTFRSLADTVAGTIGTSGEPTWLADDACDLVFDATSAARAEAAARALIGGADIDVLVQPVANRRKRLLVADMES